MINACFYIMRCSVRNSVLSKLRRLRQPKYAIALIVGGGYIGLFVGGNIIRAVTNGRAQLPFPRAVGEQWVEWGAILFGLLYLVVLWIFKAGEAGLAFKPAEVHYLFTAPATRRQIIHYYILRAQPGILFSMLVFAFFGVYWIPLVKPLYGLAAFFLIFNTLFLHQAAASLVRSSLFQHGASGLRRQWVGPVIFFAVMVVVALNAMQFDLSRLVRVEVIESFLRHGLDSPVAYFALYPLRAFGRLVASRDAATFFENLIPVAAVLALHYFWVIRSDYAFEEASHERSLRVAKRIEQFRRGIRPGAFKKTKINRQPFRLRPHGPAVTALLWKNTISVTRLPAALTLFVVATVIAGGLALWASRASAATLTGATAAMGIGGGLLVFMAPRIARNDLRQDLAYLDVIKTLPLSGRQVVIGETLAPFAFLLSILIVFVAAAFTVLIALATKAGMPFSTVVGPTLALLIVYPPFGALSLLVENAMVLYFPDWVPRASRQRRGIEMLGSGLIYFFLMFFVLWILLLPAIVVAAVGLVAGLAVFGPSMWPIATLIVAIPVALILAGESGVLVWLLGNKYESFDISSELTSPGEM